MEKGQKVILNPRVLQSSEEFIQQIIAIGEVVCTVLARTGIGVCTLLLPEGVTIQAHSHPFPDGSYKGQHYLDIHEMHLQPAP